MATLHVSPATVRVELSRTEKLLGLLRDHSFATSAVTAVEVVDDGPGAVRGLRAPGLGLRRRKVGTWRGRGRRTLVSVRSGQPAVRVSLRDQEFDEVLVSHPDARSWAEALRLALAGAGGS